MALKALCRLNFITLIHSAPSQRGRWGWPNYPCLIQADTLTQLGAGRIKTRNPSVPQPHALLQDFESEVKKTSRELPYL